MVDWSKGYSAAYYMTRVDPVTWKDIERIEITGGSVERDMDGLMQSADIDCVNYPYNTEQWIRVYLVANQYGDSDRVALFTGLGISPEITVNASKTNTSLQCYSVLKPADDVYLTRGWYVAAESNGAQQAKALLSVCSAPIEVADNSPLLQKAIIAEDGETRLTMAEKIIDAIGWALRISGDGTISIQPQNNNPVVKFDPMEYDVIETEIKSETDWFECPNVYMAIMDDSVGIARDDSPNSQFSTVTRGREIWSMEDDCILSEGQTLAEYAMIKLKEAQTASRTLSYDRRFIPDVMPGDVVRMHYPHQGFDGLFVVSSHSIEFGYGARTSEEIMEIIT